MRYAERFEDVGYGKPAILRAWHGTRVSSLEGLATRGFDLKEPAANPMRSEWREATGEALHLGRGVYVSDSYGVAERFGEVVVPVEITLRKPLVYRGTPDTLRDLFRLESVREVGYDAILLLNPEWRQAVVFETHQVRPLLHRAS